MGGEIQVGKGQERELILSQISTTDENFDPIYYMTSYCSTDC